MAFERLVKRQIQKLEEPALQLPSSKKHHTLVTQMVRYQILLESTHLFAAVFSLAFKVLRICVYSKWIHRKSNLAQVCLDGFRRAETVSSTERMSRNATFPWHLGTVCGWISRISGHYVSLLYPYILHIRKVSRTWGRAQYYTAFRLDLATFCWNITQHLEPREGDINHLTAILLQGFERRSWKWHMQWFESRFILLTTWRLAASWQSHSSDSISFPFHFANEISTKTPQSSQSSLGVFTKVSNLIRIEREYINAGSLWRMSKEANQQGSEKEDLAPYVHIVTFYAQTTARGAVVHLNSCPVSPMLSLFLPRSIIPISLAV